MPKQLPTDEKRADLLRHAADWERLAEEQQQLRTPQGTERAKLYRRTGKSLRMEAEDGVARCACCLLPYGRPH